MYIYFQILDILVSGRFQGTSCDPDKMNRTSQPEMTRSKSKYRLARRCLGVAVLFLRKQPEISIGYFSIYYK